MVQPGAGAGIIFFSPQDDLMPYSFHLGKKCTNNAAEYEALILGLQLALDFGIRVAPLLNLASSASKYCYRSIRHQI